MFPISISTILMTVITTNLFLIVLTFCFRDTRFMLQMGYRLLALFMLFALFRFLLPIELPFTVTVLLPLFLSKIIVFLHSGLFMIGEQPVSLWLLFLWIWPAGCLVGLLKYALSYYRACRHIILHQKVLTDREPYASMLDRICEEYGRPNRFAVLEMPGINAPMLFGLFSPRILIPERFSVSEEELYYVLRHEASHHFRHDLWQKSFIKLITIVYWWDPFCMALNKQADIILEMRIDNDITLTHAEQTMRYTECLLNVSERSSRTKSLPDTLTMSLLPQSHSDLYNRASLLMNNQQKDRSRLRKTLLIATCAVYLLSYMVIPEAYYAPELPLFFDAEREYVPVSLSSGNNYLIDNEDGTYDFYYSGMYQETVDSLKYYPKDVPLYTRENCPY